jgi:hypothetical protein
MRISGLFWHRVLFAKKGEEYLIVIRVRASVEETEHLKKHVLKEIADKVFFWENKK